MQVVLNLSHLLFGVIRISGLSKTIVYTKTLISRVILNQIRRKMYECIRIRASNKGPVNGQCPLKNRFCAVKVLRWPENLSDRLRW